MGLWQRNPFSRSDTQPLYTLAQTNTVLIVGLGNKGKEYDDTRHNIGFACVDAFAAAHEFPAWSEKKSLKGLVSLHSLSDTRVILLKPTTFMNLSGEALQAAMKFYKVPADKVLIVHDELDIPFGQIRLRTGGSSAGNNGLKSIIQHLGKAADQTGRVRIGIKAETKVPAADFVLQKFSNTEQGHLKNLEREVVSILTDAIFAGDLPTETRSFLS